MSKGAGKKKLVWVTPDAFMDTDYNPALFKLLLKTYQISWIIYSPKGGGFFKESDFNEMRTWEDLDIQFMYISYRQRDPRRLLFYLNMYRQINKSHYDLMYFSAGPADPFALPLLWSFKKNKTVYSVHEGNINDNFKWPIVSKIILDSIYPYVKFVQMFSAESASLFHKKYPKPKIFTIPLALKDFGKSHLQKRNDAVVFLSFGIISHAKNIDLLIEAACNIYEQGYKNFKVSINGGCDNWDFYQSKIRYPEIFNCNIRKIDNSEIPDVFSQSHYLVQPYRSSSQSGVLKIALNYNIPIIASDLPGFREEIVEGVNGFFFEQGNLKDLESVLKNVLDGHQKNYGSLQEKQREFTDSKYSAEKINAQFAYMFSEVINTKN